MRGFSTVPGAGFKTAGAGLLALMAAIGGSHAATTEAEPSFDCDKAKAPIAIMICTDGALGHLDGALGAAYSKRRAGLSGEGKEQLLRKQRAWLKRRAEACPLPKDPETDIIGRWQAQPCLKTLYEERIRALGGKVPTLPKGAPADMVPPLCLDPLVNGSGEADARIREIDLAACRTALANVPVDPGVDGYEFQRRADFRYPAGTLGYKQLGTLSGGGWVIAVADSGGGTGWFSSVMVLKKTADRLTVEQDIPFGDRCNGGLDSAKLEAGGKLSVSVNITPYDLAVLSLGPKSSGIPGVKAYDDLDASAAGCIGTSLYTISFATGASELTGARIGDLKDEESASGFRLEPCFNKVIRSVVKKLPGSVDLAGLKRLTEDFEKQCVKG